MGKGDEILLPALAESDGVRVMVQVGNLDAGNPEGAVGVIVADFLPEKVLDGLHEGFDTGPFGVDQGSVYVENGEFIHGSPKIR